MNIHHLPGINDSDFLRSVGLDIRFHGNGFIQVMLNDISRLHIWSPKFPATRVENAQIHDHRFWFTSRILMGALKHTTYGMFPSEFGQHGLYQTHGKTKLSVLKKVGACDLVESREVVYRAGDNYSFGGPNKFHETSARRIDRYGDK